MAFCIAFVGDRGAPSGNVEIQLTVGKAASSSTFDGDSLISWSRPRRRGDGWTILLSPSPPVMVNERGGGGGEYEACGME